MTAPSDQQTGPAENIGHAEKTGPAASTGERAVPYCCPFCTEEDLRPLESGAVPGLTRGGWHCRSCLRVFSLTFHGLHQPVLPHLPDSQPISTIVRPPVERERS